MGVVLRSEDVLFSLGDDRCGSLFGSNVVCSRAAVDENLDVLLVGETLEVVEWELFGVSAIVVLVDCVFLDWLSSVWTEVEVAEEVDGVSQRSGDISFDAGE